MFTCLSSEFTDGNGTGHISCRCSGYHCDRNPWKITEVLVPAHVCRCTPQNITSSVPHRKYRCSTLGYCFCAAAGKRSTFDFFGNLLPPPTTGETIHELMFDSSSSGQQIGLLLNLSFSATIWIRRV